jgi:S-adenosyl-L-methionine hydrolase (adenosine-forming)
MALLTLTSDIGQQDYLVGAIKGELLKLSPHFRIADISHHLLPFNYPQAAYVARNAIRNFPSHTFHLVLVNLFESKPEQLLLAFHNDQYILCADNGLLSMILETKPELVMGQAILKLVEGIGLAQIGQPDVPYIEKNALRPLLGDNWIEGQIIFIDNFENVVVNITHEQFEDQRKGRGFRIVFKRNEVIDRISETYADVPEGEKLALFNSAGYLEIAVNKGNAAGLFGLQGYLEQAQNQYLQARLFYQTVRIFFE